VCTQPYRMVFPVVTYNTTMEEEVGSGNTLTRVTIHQWKTCH
jgi:hypothetical protein